MKQPVVTNALLGAWRLLPIKYRARIKQADLDTIRLDYPAKEILLRVESKIDLRRAQSCEKEPGTVQWIEEFVEDGSVLFDIGANVGAYSLIAAAKSGGRTRVYAFEPGFSTYPQLCRNIMLNNLQASVFPLNIALSGEAGLKSFQYRTLTPGAGEHLGLSEDESLSAQHSKDSVFSQPILVYPLDEVIASFGLPVPNHVKIDVDGHEYDILRGAGKVLGDPALRTIQIEIGEKDKYGPQIKELLEAKGFRIRKKSQHGTGPIADYVFARS